MGKYSKTKGGKIMKKIIVLIVSLLIFPSFAMAADGKFEYDISYTRIFPPTTSKQVIAGYLSGDNPYFRGVLKRVTYYERSNTSTNFSPTENSLTILMAG